MELCDKYLLELIKLDPILNDYFCLEDFKKYSHILPNYFSDEYSKKTNELDEKYIELLENKKNKTLYDKILYRDLTHNYNFNDIDYYLPINYDNNIFSIIVEDINNDGFFKFKNKNDIEIYIKRLKKLNVITDSIIKCFKDGIKNNVTMYRENLDILINSFNDILKEKKYILKKDIPSKNIFNKECEKYYVKNIKKLLDFLNNEYYLHSTNKLGICHYSGGKTAYKNILKYNLYNFATPENIHQLGLSEIKNIVKELNKISDKYKVYEKISDDEMYNKLNKIKFRLNKNSKKYFYNTLSKNKIYNVKQNSSSDVDAYYKNNKNSTGTFYFNPKNIFNDELLVLSLHEGIPGHHYQNFYEKKFPLYIQYFSSTGYVEGWGLYSENLYDYKDKSEYYFKLRYDLLRCIRLVLDTGIHYYGWTKEDCLEFNEKYLGKNHKCEYNRLVNEPGRDVCYKVGEKTISFLKDKYLEKNPKGIKEFHEKILNIGPIPLENLLKEMK